MKSYDIYGIPNTFIFKIILSALSTVRVALFSQAIIKVVVSDVIKTTGHPLNSPNYTILFLRIIWMKLFARGWIPLQ